MQLKGRVEKKNTIQISTFSALHVSLVRTVGQMFVSAFMH